MSERIDALLKELTLDEKISLVAGADMWRTPAVERLGIPRLKVTDGPSGARGGSFSGEVTSASFPCGSAIAATWDPELIEALGGAAAEEAKSKGCHVLLGPTINLHRHPLGGRHFECYSEDPLLSGEIAVALIRGLQAGGVGGCAKHFVGNDTEFERHTISSEIDERTLRELYLAPFEHAVKRAGVWSVMSAYNRVNGTYMSAQGPLLRGVLKGEWGFDGFVVSDWFGTQGTVESANGGLDLEMPAPARFFGDALREAVAAGEVEEGTLDDKVRRLLLAMERTGAFSEAGQPEAAERAEDRPEHRALARRVAGEAIVLLRNEGGALPFATEGDGAIRSLAVIGPAARFTAIQGGGSARVTPHYQVSILEGLEAAAGDAEIRYGQGCTNHKRLPRLGAPLLDGPARLTFRNGDAFEGPADYERRSSRLEYNWFGRFRKEIDPRSFTVRIEATLLPTESGTWTLSLTSAGRSRLRVDGRELVDNWTSQERGDAFFGGGSTEALARVELEAGRRYDLEIDFAKGPDEVVAGLHVGCLPPVSDDALAEAVALARACDAAVVCVGTNPDWETEGHDRGDLALPGRQAELVEAVAAANPRTVVVLNVGAPVEMPWLDKVAGVLVSWYGGQESGNAVADVLFGARSPSGRLPTSWARHLEDTAAFVNYPGENGAVRYGEGLFMGYRWFDARRAEPLFPFGHGLSYASFAYANAEAHVEEGDGGEGVRARVSVDVTNRSDRSAREVVQLYVADPDASLARPVQELRGFAHVELGAGETRRVSLELGSEAFAFWDPARALWVAEAGRYELRLGTSSRDPRATAEVTLEREHTAPASRTLG